MSFDPNQVKGNRFGIGMMVLFAGLAVLYSLVNPLFEAPDEVWHYEYVRWLKEGKGLAAPEDVGKAPWAQEGSQPPLYYLMGALLTAWAPTTNADNVIQYNPHVAMGNADAFGNKNMMIHGNIHRWPWQGVAVAAYVVRFFSVFLGAITVGFTFYLCRTIWPQSPLLAAVGAGLVAFNPQFIFISSAISNDNLVTACCTIGLWLLADLFTPGKLPPTDKRLFQLGIVVGAAALSKLSGLLLGVAAFLSLCVLAWQQHSLRQFFRSNFVVCATALAVAGWWYIRNWLLWGDPLALTAMFAVLPARAERADLAELLSLAPGVWRSFWAVFGWFNIVADEWVYLFYTALTLIGLSGLFFGLVQTVRKQSAISRITATRLFLLGGWTLGVTALLIRWAQINYPQGRLLFPAIGAIMPLIAWGILQWLPQRWQSYVGAGLLVTVCGIAVVAPFRWITPAYAVPGLAQDPVEAIQPAQVNFGSQLQLTGYRIEQTAIYPGETLDVTLYWQALTPIQTNYSIFVHVIDELDLLVAQRDSYPALGNFPTSQWPTHTTIVDRHRLLIPTNVYSPNQLRIEIGWYDFATGQRLPVAQRDSWLLATIPLQARETDAGVPSATLQVNFDNQIMLIGHQFNRRLLKPGDPLQLTIWWQAQRDIQKDYKVFTHLVLPPEAVWAQDDQRPQEGKMPTATWRAGMVIQDDYLMPLPEEAPPGVYFVEVGLYDPETGERLQVNFSDKGVVLGQVKVVSD